VHCALYNVQCLRYLIFYILHLDIEILSDYLPKLDALNRTGPLGCKQALVTLCGSTGAQMKDEIQQQYNLYSYILEQVQVLIEGDIRGNFTANERSQIHRLVQETRKLIEYHSDTRVDLCRAFVSICSTIIRRKIWSQLRHL